MPPDKTRNLVQSSLLRDTANQRQWKVVEQVRRSPGRQGTR